LLLLYYINLENAVTHTQLQQVLDYIQTHLDRDLSLVELAETLNLSPTYFASVFKQAIDISPHQYVIQQRVEQAKLMLSKTDLAIADIALRTLAEITCPNLFAGTHPGKAFALKEG
jgi:AraC family transcriptional regulator